MKIFVSYAQADRQYLEELARPLTMSAKAPCPGARLVWDRDIEPGVDWQTWINDQIEQADLIVLLGSVNWVNSPFVIGQEVPRILARWQANQDSVFPILLTTIDVVQAKPLMALQWAPSGKGLLSKKNDISDYAEALAEIQRKFSARVEKIFGSNPALRAAAVPHAQAEWIDKEHLASVVDLRGAPFVRIFLQMSGDSNCHVEVEVTTPAGAHAQGGAPAPGAETTRRPFNFTLTKFDDAQLIWDTITSDTRDPETYVRLTNMLQLARDIGQPVRVHVAFARSARSLDRLNWEGVNWNGLILGRSSSMIFARQYTFPDADYGDLQIKPKKQVTYKRLDIKGAPNQSPAIAWKVPLAPAGQAAADLGAGVVAIASTTPAKLKAVKDVILEAEVLCLELISGVSNGPNPEIYISWPGASGNLQAQTLDALCDTIAAAREDRPALVILAPHVGGGSPVNAALAEKLAAVRVPAVIAAIGNVQAADWQRVLTRLFSDLRVHGIIDLAVAIARQSARESGFDLRLYLRSRSARLWYEPGFVRPNGDAVPFPDAWAKLGIAFSADNKRGCIAVIGAHLDRELTISRRAIAERLAAEHRFALSRKDREDLETVTEFIYVSGDRQHDARPHITAFVKAACDIMREKLQVPVATDSAAEIARTLWLQQRPNRPAASDPFLALAKLKSPVYLTAYFNEVLEDLLKDKAQDRQPSIVTSVAHAPDEFENQQTAITVDAPAVIHLFGSFKDADSLLISKSDYLDFFNILHDKRRPTTEFVRARLAEASLFIIGFRASSSELRMLLALHRSLLGRDFNVGATHIAVQIDPEDDHTLDPEGARSFYQGLLSDLGSEVLVYWGTPSEFLMEMRSACPGAFLP